MDVQVRGINGITTAGRNGFRISVDADDWMLKDLMAIICEQLGDTAFIEEVKRIVEEDYE